MLENKIKVYHATGYYGYSDWIPKVEIVHNIEEADLVLFEGGEDINPALYDEPAGRFTHFYQRRDDIEVRAFNEAKRLGISMWGTCRGAQLSCVLSGGKLIQDMNHHRSHELTMYDGTKFITNTLHHQMAYPYNLVKGEDYYILAAAYGLSNTYEDGWGKQIDMPVKNNKGLIEEPEFIYYPKISNLSIQGHPEMMDSDSKMVTICRVFLDLLLKGVLEDVLQLNIGVDELIARSDNFKFSKEELVILESIKSNNKVEYAGA